MASNLIINVKQLVNTRTESHMLRGKEMAALPSITDAYLIIEDSIISEYGSMQKFTEEKKSKNNNIIDAKGAMILPCWCDSHSHLVFAGSREDEFVDKLKGLSYAEINARGGGILNSSQKLNDANEDELFNEAWKRTEEISRLGTGAIEIKSGYGLS